MSSTKKGGAATPKTANENAKTDLQKYQDKMNKVIKKPMFRVIAALLMAWAGYEMFNENALGCSMAVLMLLPDGMQLSGRSGGIVFQRNGRRRVFVMPSLVQNSYTQNVRAVFGSYSAGFRALSQALQDAWNNAVGFTYTDVFGRVYTLNGKALYQRLNQNLAAIGQSGITAVPSAAAVPGITDLTATIDDSANTYSLAFSPTPTDAAVDHILMATIGMSAGINRPRKSDFRQIGTIPGGATTPFDFAAEYTGKFGAAVTGQKIFIKVIPVNNTTGQAGTEAIGGTTVIA